MKKLLVALMACVLLAGCGGGGSKDKYTAGTYTGTAKGNNGDVTVEVTVDAAKITGVTVKEHAETAGLADPALDKIPAAIVEKNGTDGVETVTGATNTSKAIINAVNSALEGAAKK